MNSVARKPFLSDQIYKSHAMGISREVQSSWSDPASRPTFAETMIARMMTQFAVEAEEFLSQTCKIDCVPHRTDLEILPEYEILREKVRGHLKRQKPVLNKRALAAVDLLEHVWAFRDELSRRGFGAMSSILAAHAGNLYAIVFSGQKTSVTASKADISTLRSAWAEAKKEMLNANQRPVRKKIAELAQAKLARMNIKISINTLVRDQRLK